MRKNNLRAECAVLKGREIGNEETSSRRTNALPNAPTIPVCRYLPVVERLTTSKVKLAIRVGLYEGAYHLYGEFSPNLT